MSGAERRDPVGSETGPRHSHFKAAHYACSGDNHRHAVALHYMYYNVCKVHQTLRVTPAMEARIADHVWSLEELVGLVKQRATA
jgi:hypothetical protein